MSLLVAILLPHAGESGLTFGSLLEIDSNRIVSLGQGLEYFQVLDAGGLVELVKQGRIIHQRGPEVCLLSNVLILIFNQIFQVSWNQINKINKYLPLKYSISLPSSIDLVNRSPLKLRTDLTNDVVEAGVLGSSTGTSFSVSATRVPYILLIRALLSSMKVPMRFL